MCRLVAYAGPELAVSRALYSGAHSLHRQAWAPRELLSGSVNADGYGIAWFGPDGQRTPVRIARAEPVWYDPELETLLDQVSSRVVAVLLRNATPGLPVELSGVGPFTGGGWAFMLNGFVPEFRPRHMRALRSLLSDDLYGRLTGVADAETLFLLALGQLQSGATPVQALEYVVDAVAQRLGPDESAPLTMVLTSPDGHWALTTNAGRGPCNSLYRCTAPACLGYGRALASEPLDDSPWSHVEPDTVHTLPADTAGS